MSTHPVKKRTAESLRLQARARRLCMALPGVEEKLAWGEPTWRVGGRLFAQLDDHHHGAAHVSLWLATEREAQLALVEAEPARFFVPPYVGHAGWVAAILDGPCDWDMVGAVIEQAYQRIAAKAKAPRSRAAAAMKKLAPAKRAPASKPTSAKKAPRATASKPTPAKKAPRATASKPAPAKKAPRAGNPKPKATKRTR